jgi:hypothetical protein
MPKTPGNYTIFSYCDKCKRKWCYICERKFCGTLPSSSLEYYGGCNIEITFNQYDTCAFCNNDEVTKDAIADQLIDTLVRSGRMEELFNMSGHSFEPVKNTVKRCITTGSDPRKERKTGDD